MLRRARTDAPRQATARLLGEAVDGVSIEDAEAALTKAQRSLDGCQRDGELLRQAAVDAERDLRIVRGNLPERISAVIANSAAVNSLLAAHRAAQDHLAEIEAILEPDSKAYVANHQ